MGELISKDQGGIISLMHAGGNTGLSKPFERDIYLFDTYVAGTRYVEGIEELAAHLHAGDELAFFREPDNPYDWKAIVIRTAEGAKIGYVPRKDNLIFARLMDAGKLVLGKIDSLEIEDKWVHIDIKIFLRD